MNSKFKWMKKINKLIIYNNSWNNIKIMRIKIINKKTLTYCNKLVNINNKFLLGD